MKSLVQELPDRRLKPIGTRPVATHCRVRNADAASGSAVQRVALSLAANYLAAKLEIRSANLAIGSKGESIAPQGACEAHWARAHVSVPAFRLGLCESCFYGAPTYKSSDGRRCKKADYTQIARDRSSGMTFREIAEKHGVSKGTVQHALKSVLQI